MKTYKTNIQGDVLLVKLDMLPEGNHTKEKSPTLALGEVTGHSHRMENGGDVLTLERPIVVKNKRGKEVAISRVLVVNDSGVLVHQEHAAQEIPVGVYGIIIQREYEPEAWNEVQD